MARATGLAARSAPPQSAEAATVSADLARDAAGLTARTDSYFVKSKAIVERFGDREATYAVFMRRPVISAPRFAVDFLESMAAARGTRFEIELNYPEANWVGAGEPILYVTGRLQYLVDL